MLLIMRLPFGAASLAVALLSFPLAAQVREQISVERILIDARVTNYNGDPVLGLKADDFLVKVDGKPAAVLSAEWIPETAAQRELAGMDEDQRPVVTATSEEPLPQGRLFIYFVQTDFARNAVRVSGYMSFISYADQMIDDLEQGDRVAVFSFDSHLKFRLDFTDNKGDLKHAIRDAMAIDDPPPPQIVPNPSLARRLDREQMKKCTTSDEAFILIANAVRPIAGPKSMILFGWGLGRLANGQVVMERKYPIARYALETSRVTVFAIDTTAADYHTLEAGLQKAAADTGGLYARAYHFPQLAVNRVQKAVSGHYELEVRKPVLGRRGTHLIDVNVKRPKTYVMARSSYVDTD